MIKKLLCTVLLVSCMLLTACGSKKDDVADELAELNSEKGHTGTDAETDAAFEGIPDRLEYEFSTNSGYKVKVNADVDSVGSESIGVYAIKRKTVDSAYIKRLGDAFFGENNYTYIKPYATMTRDELESEAAYLRERMKNLGDEGKAQYRVIQFYGAATQILAADRIADNPEQEEELVFKLPFWDPKYGYATNPEGEDAYANFGKNYKIADSECSRLRGNVGDDTWEMYYDSYNLSPEGQNPESYKINVGIRNIAFRKTGLLKPIKYEVKVNPDETNACDYDGAKQDADSMLAKLGFADDWTIIRENQLEVCPEDESSLSEVDGYAFYYSPSLGKGRGIYFGENMICPLGGRVVLTGYTVSQPGIVVRVTSEGVIELDINGVYDTPTEMIGDAKAFSFDKIDSLARDYMSNSLIAGATIDHISFGYACISYDGNDCAMVPVWIYYSGYSGSRVDGEPRAVINALDGTTIDTGLWMKVYGYYPYVLPY